MAQLTTAGLIIRRYPEILTAIQDAMRTNISSGLIFDEDTILGQITQILANEFAVMEEMLQALDDTMDRDKAEGAALDKLLYLIGLERLQAARSSGFVQFITRPDVTIPLGTIVQNPSSGDRFFSTLPVTSSTTNALQVWWRPDVKNSTTYTISVNGSDFSYTSDASATDSEIITGLASAINAVASVNYEAGADVQDGVNLLKVQTKTESTISVTSVQDLEATRVRISVPVEAEVFGAINAPIGSITALVSGLGGVFSLRNDEKLGVGRLTETDSEFRLRATQSLSVPGSSTFSAIYTALTSLPEVSNVLLLENNTAVTDSNGLPPHSFEAIVDIPDTLANDKLIAETLWNEKPIGIQSYGTVSVDFVDAIGETRTLQFSRPEDEWIAIRVTYTRYDEETVSANIGELIKDAVIAYGQTLTSGEDVIPRRFVGGIYGNTSGLDEVIVEAQVLPTSGSTPVPGSWSQNRIPVTPRKTAAFLRTNITVVDATP